MDEKLKNVTQWTLYILVMVFALFTLISLGIIVLAPTLFPELNIDGFKSYINTLCVILSVLSVGLGVYSIKQASASGKQANEMMDSIRALEQKQDILLVTLKSTKDSRIVSANNTNSQWEPDDVSR